jgi:hypothetical protein
MGSTAPAPTPAPAKGWGISFSGLASEAKAWLEKEFAAEAAKYEPAAQNAIGQAKTIFSAFLAAVKSDAQVAISAADSDLAGDGINVITSTTNHPPAAPPAD